MSWPLPLRLAPAVPPHAGEGFANVPLLSSSLGLRMCSYKCRLDRSLIERTTQYQPARAGHFLSATRLPACSPPACGQRRFQLTHSLYTGLLKFSCRPVLLQAGAHTGTAINKHEMQKSNIYDWYRSPRPSAPPLVSPLQPLSKNADHEYCIRSPIAAVHSTPAPFLRQRWPPHVAPQLRPHCSPLPLQCCLAQQAGKYTACWSADHHS